MSFSEDMVVHFFANCIKNGKIGVQIFCKAMSLHGDITIVKCGICFTQKIGGHNVICIQNYCNII